MTREDYLKRLWPQILPLMVTTTSYSNGQDSRGCWPTQRKSALRRNAARRGYRFIALVEGTRPATSADALEAPSALGSAGS